MSADALDALHAIDPGLPREPWVKLAFACKDAGITEDEWLTWCSGGGNFNHADAVSTYRNAKPKAGGVTASTLYMMARDAGWKPEAAARAQGGNGAGGVHRAAPAVASAQPEQPPTDPLPVWAACQPVQVHPYTSRKKIGTHGARVNAPGWLVVPYHNRDRQLQTLQHIAADGTKRFLAGAKAKGSVFLAGNPVDAQVVVIAEGYATACAIEEATGYPTLAAGSRVSFPECARIARHFAPDARVIVAADRGDLATPLAAARCVAGFLALPGPETSAEGYDFADWRIDGATDAEIKARLEHAPPVPPPADGHAPTHTNAQTEGSVTHDEPPPLGVEQRPTVKLVPNARGAVGAYLVDGKGRAVPNIHNLHTYLEADGLGPIREDVFTGKITWRGEPLEGGNPFTKLTIAIQAAVIDGRRPFIKVGTPMVEEAALQVAARNSFNSAADWLASLTWDGTERINRFLPDVCEVEATQYAQDVSRYFWLGMVQRMVHPGAQVDSIITLVGPQGIGKSSLARIVGGDYYGAVGLGDIGTKDWCLSLRGRVLVELDELSGHTRAELENTKAILTRPTDNYRPPYGRTSVDVPRTCVMMGTTNERQFLMDTSGNRRWLPFECVAPFALDAARASREACYAEAYHLVMQGLPNTWHVVAGAADMQAEHMAPEMWVDLLTERLRESEASPGELPIQITSTAVAKILGIPAEKMHTGIARRIASTMRALGYVTARIEVGSSVDRRERVRGFIRPGDASVPGPETNGDG